MDELVIDNMAMTGSENPHVITTGRLILNGRGLYFVAGPVVAPEPRRTATAGNPAVAIVSLAFAITSSAAAVAAERGQVDVNDEFSHKVKAVKGLPADEQVRQVAGSFHLSWAELEQVSFPFLSPMKVVTATHGNRYHFNVSGRARAAAKAWWDARRGAAARV